MEDLLSREAYAEDETGYWPRLAIAVAIVAALCLGIFVFLVLRGSVAQLFKDLHWSAGVLDGPARTLMAVAGGLLFGSVFSGLFCSQLRRVHQAGIDALFSESDSLVKAPGAGEFSHRLVCSWMISERFGICGVLFLGKEKWEFVPRRENLPRHRKIREIGPLGEVDVAAVVSTRNLLQRVLTVRAERRLLISWRTGEARLAIPRAMEVSDKLKRIVCARNAQQ